MTRKSHAQRVLMKSLLALLALCATGVSPVNVFAQELNHNQNQNLKLKPVIQKDKDTPSASVQPITSATAVSAVRSSPTVLLYTHPTHLLWIGWILDEFEAHPHNRHLIDGVICIFVEDDGDDSDCTSVTDGEKHFNVIRDRVTALGWEFIPGIRASADSSASLERDPFQTSWHQQHVNWCKTFKNFALDGEPYFQASKRYHADRETARLYHASTPWQQLSGHDMYIYPLGPPYNEMQAVADNALHTDDALRPGNRVIAMYPLFYDPYRIANWKEELRAFVQWCKLRGYVPCPGFYLAALLDEDIMNEVRLQNLEYIYLYARTGNSYGVNHPDKLFQFGSDEWSENAKKLKE